MATRAELNALNPNALQRAPVTVAPTPYVRPTTGSGFASGGRSIAGGSTTPSVTPPANFSTTWTPPANPPTPGAAGSYIGGSTAGGTPAENIFIDQGGGLNTGLLSGMINSIWSQAWPNYQNWSQSGQAPAEWFAQYMDNNFPYSFMPQVSSALQSNLGTGQNMMGNGANYLNSYYPSMQNQINSLMGQGSGINANSTQLGQMGMGNLNQNNNLLNTIMTQGLPGQNNLYSMMDTGMQQASQVPLLMNYIQGLGTGGGPTSSIIDNGMQQASSVPGLQNWVLNAAQGGMPGQGAVSSVIGDQLASGQNMQNLANTPLAYLMQQGLPNQQGMEALFPMLAQSGQQMQTGAGDLMNLLQAGGGVSSDAQTQLQNQLMSLVSGSGLTPEYVQAARENILAPQQEDLMGQLNKMAGGSASLLSPAYQELLARNEREFNNNLIMSGQQNLGNYLSQAGQQTSQPYQQGLNLANLMLGGGQGALGQAMQAYSTIPSASTPVLQLAQQSAQNQLGTGMNAYNLTSQTQLPYAQLAAQMGQQGTSNVLGALAGQLPYSQLAGQLGQQGTSNTLNAFQTLANSAYPYVNLQAQQGNNQLDQQLQNYLGSIQGLQGMTGMAQQPYQLGENTANSALGQMESTNQNMLNQILQYTQMMQNYGNQVSQVPMDLTQLFSGLYTNQQNVNASNSGNFWSGLASTLASVAPLLLA